jgi:magnesium chelatase family protein
MAHRGVLFLDELPEFRRNVLEVLRQPLEEGVVRLARAAQHVTYPCSVMLVAAMNPCPCGYFKVKDRQCKCQRQRVLDYHGRISGPLLDRLDITLETHPVDVASLIRIALDDKPTSWYRERVEAARERQRARFAEEPGVYCNAQMGPRLMWRHCQVSGFAQLNLKKAIDRYALSARAYDRILRLARSRADLEDRPAIEDEDIRFAISCRKLDRPDYLPDRSGPAPQAGALG